MNGAKRLWRSPIFWSINDGIVVAAVWFRLIPWWLVAVLVMIDCALHALRQWEKAVLA